LKFFSLSQTRTVGSSFKVPALSWFRAPSLFFLLRWLISGSSLIFVYFFSGIRCFNLYFVCIFFFKGLLLPFVFRFFSLYFIDLLAELFVGTATNLMVVWLLHFCMMLHYEFKLMLSIICVYVHSKCLKKFPIDEAHGQERRGQKIGVCVSHSNIIERRSHRKNTNQGSL